MPLTLAGVGEEVTITRIGIRLTGKALIKEELWIWELQKELIYISVK